MNPNLNPETGTNQPKPTVNPTVVKNELNEALSKFDEAYDHLKRAMAYVDGETYNELEDIRKRLVNVILDIDKVIERIE
jgi:hypothetical protein